MTYVPQNDTERINMNDEGRNSGHAGDEEWISCSCRAD